VLCDLGRPTTLCYIAQILISQLEEVQFQRTRLCLTLRLSTNKCSVLSVLCESVKVIFSEYHPETLARPMYQWRTKLRFENCVVGLTCLAPGVRLMINGSFPVQRMGYVSSLLSRINAAWKDVRALWRLVVATERPSTSSV
jgi:hypothetical protein